MTVQIHVALQCAHDGAVWSVCVAPDRRGFVTGSADHTVKFWEFELVSDEEVKSR